MIMFFGSVFVDIIANVDEAFLKKYHLKPDEAIRGTPETESIFQEVMQYDPILRPGGSILNSARLFQWVSKKSYPLVLSGSAIGFDDYGRLVKTSLREEEINCDLIESTDVFTGVAVVLITNLMRTMVSYHGPSKELLAKHSEKQLWQRLHEVEFFYFSVS